MLSNFFQTLWNKYKNKDGDDQNDCISQTSKWTNK